MLSVYDYILNCREGMKNTYIMIIKFQLASYSSQLISYFYVM